MSTEYEDSKNRLMHCPGVHPDMRVFIRGAVRRMAASTTTTTTTSSSSTTTTTTA